MASGDLYALLKDGAKERFGLGISRFHNICLKQARFRFVRGKIIIEKYDSV